MIDEARARQLWEDEIQHPVSDADWANLKSVLLGALRGELATDPDRDLEFDTPSQALEELRAAEARARLTWPADPDWNSPVTPPDSWTRHSQRVLESRWVTLLQLATLKALGLEGPLQFHQVAPFLVRLAAQQNWPTAPCEVLTLHLPTLNEDGSVKGITRILVYDSREDSGLHVAIGVAKVLENGLGLDSWSALYYLLTCIHIELPWIKTSSIGGPIRMVIPSREVRPEEVATAYARARAAAETENGSDTYRLIAAYKRAAGTGEDLLAFCQTRRSKGLGWQQISEQWNKAHPERSYASGDNLSRVYRRIVSQASGAGGAS